MHLVRVFVAAAVVGLLAAAALAGTTTPPPCGGCNVVYISIDPLRADHMGVYGYDRNTTPHIDRLADDSHVFTRAFSQASHTLPALYSTLSGTYPPEHGMVPGADSANMTLLAEVFDAAGYRTYGMGGSHVVGARYGFDAGFDRWELAWWLDGPNIPMPEQPGRIGYWLGTDDRPFFLLYQTFTLHDPYFTPENLSGMYPGYLPAYEQRARERWATMQEQYGPFELLNRFRPFYFDPARENETVGRHLVAQYDTRITRADRTVGRIVELLRARGLADDTIVIINAQHGEQFGEHGRWRHTTSLFNEVVRVPLIVHVPGTGSSRTAATVENLDIPSTLIELTGISGAADRTGFAAQNRGVSLAPLLSGGTIDKRFLYATGYNDSYMFLDPDTRRKLYNGRTGTRVYDLDTDFAEQHPLPRNRTTAIRETADAVHTALSADGTGLAATWPYIDPR